ncbi:MAG: methylmalonyl-CoA mutase family protein [Hyphomicrobiaceae bacterium]
MQTDATLPLAADFPAATRDDWMNLVAKVLKGADFDKRLVTRTAEGLAIQPLYTRADALPATLATTPDQPPFTRGHAADGLGWDIRQRFADTDPAHANAAILADLEGGVSSIILQIAAPGQSGLPVDGLAAALAGVLLDVCPVALEAGELAVEAAAALDAAWAARGVPTERRLGAYGADPIGTLARNGSLGTPVATLLSQAAKLAAAARSAPHLTALLADGRPYHGAGASDAQELGAMVATFVAYLRAAEAQGLAPAEAFPKIAVALAVDTDQFLGIAKLRAARSLLWQVASACHAGPAAGRVHLTAETAARVYARRDPWVNILRATMAGSAAAMGGADAISVLPFTWALGQPDAFARRIGRNTQIVLQEEASLGRVADPAGGSWYVERLTDDLAKAAWEVFQEIEAEGGIVAALKSGHLQDMIAANAAARERQISTGRTELTGVSAFPRLGDDGATAPPHPVPPPVRQDGERVTALTLRRLAAPFEALRDRADCAAAGGHKPVVFLASLGTLAEFNTSATWITNYLAAGGIEAIASAGFTNSADAGAAFAASGARVACLCSTDAVYGELGEATASVLKAAGAIHVCLAGRPKDQEAALRAAGVDTFMFAGSDAVETLARLHEVFGTPT